MRAKWNFHHIWIVMEKLVVKRVPGGPHVDPMTPWTLLSAQGGYYSTPKVSGRLSVLLKVRSRNRHRNLWGGQYVSSTMVTQFIDDLWFVQIPTRILRLHIIFIEMSNWWGKGLLMVAYPFCLYPPPYDVSVQWLSFRITDWTSYHKISTSDLYTKPCMISRSVSGLVADSPCGVWGLLHGGPLLGFCF